MNWTNEILIYNLVIILFKWLAVNVISLSKSQYINSLALYSKVQRGAKKLLQTT